MRTTSSRLHAGHPVRVALPADLPLLEFDAVLLERVFCNLLENAAKYAPAGSAVEIGASQLDDHVEIRVCDHGQGFPAGNLNALFEMFARAQTESGKRGTGLGLAISRANSSKRTAARSVPKILRKAAPASFSRCPKGCRRSWRRKAHERPQPQGPADRG